MGRNFRRGSGTATGSIRLQPTGTGRVAEMVDPHTPRNHLLCQRLNEYSLVYVSVVFYGLVCNFCYFGLLLTLDKRSRAFSSI